MKTEIDLEKDFVDAKAVCANKMIKNNRSFLAFCDARTKAFVKNYMKEPTWEWNFCQDDIEAAKRLTFDAWYKKVDVRDYFLDSTLLKDLLAGLSADEVKVLLYSEMKLFYDAFTKEEQKNWVEKDPDRLEEEKCEECGKEEEEAEDKKEDKKEDKNASQLFTDALNKALNMAKGAADGRAARDALNSMKHCGDDLFCEEDGSEDEDSEKEDEHYDNDGDFMCADLKDLFKSLHNNIDSLIKELKDIIAEEDKKEEESKKKGKKKKNEDQGD